MKNRPRVPARMPVAPIAAHLAMPLCTLCGGSAKFVSRPSRALMGDINSSRVSKLQSYEGETGRGHNVRQQSPAAGISGGTTWTQ